MDLWNNTYTTAANTDYCIYFLEWHPGVLDGISFNNDECLTTGGGEAVYFKDTTSYPDDNATNITFCGLEVDGEPFDEADITENNPGNNTYTITTSNCLGTTPAGSGGGTPTDAVNSAAGVIFRGATFR